MISKPKILLLLPPAFLYPMGSAYVATTLKNAGYDFDIYGFFYDNRAWLKKNIVNAENNIEHEGSFTHKISSLSSHEFLFELIAKENYNYILVGGLIGFFRWFYQILPQIKGYNPACKIIMGGGITKDLPENVIFEKLHVDYILKGEAETNLVALLTLLEQNDSNTNTNEMGTIPGLCWKDRSSAIKKNPTLRFDLDKDDILPAWDAFNIKEYITLSDTLFRFNKTFFPILAGRGCPNVCAFCSPSIGRFTPRSVDSVLSEMKHWVQKYDFDFFFIYSEVAFNDEEYTQKFCKKYKKEIAKPWVGQLRTDVQFSLETYKLMKESGCMFISLGFESANDRILKVMKKNTSFSDHVRNMTLAKEAEINIFGNFMFGHATETAEEIRETFGFLNKYDLIYGPSNGLATIITYPGTGYYRNAEKNGLINDPFKFLLTYSLKAGISPVNLREKDDATRLNISALSNDEFYNVVCTENIKHRRLYSKRHAAVEIERDFELGSNAGFTFKGKCPSCGEVVKFDQKTYINPLNILKICDTCFYTVNLDIYQFPETGAYLTQLQNKIENSQKIVVYGSWIMDLIFCGPLSIPYENIIAWIDPDNSEVSDYKYIYHMPQMSRKELQECEYDTIITLKPRALSTPQRMEADDLNSQCQVIHLFPDILNEEILKKLIGKKIATIGMSEAVEKVYRLLEAANITNTVEHFSKIADVCNDNSKYDYIILDTLEHDIDRQKFAQNSLYQINEILHVDFLYDGGFYTGC